MKISEVVTLHPSVAAKAEYDMLLHTDSQDDIIAFIMDDNNPEARRIEMLKHLDILLGAVADHFVTDYGPEDLDNFMHDQGPQGWQTKLQNNLDSLGDKYKGKWDDKISNMTDEEEAIQFAKDFKLPPYHLAVVDETQDEDIPTGEYEICQTCGGEGCRDCEEGLKDITGMHKIPDFSDYKGE